MFSKTLTLEYYLNIPYLKEKSSWCETKRKFKAYVVYVKCESLLSILWIRTLHP